MGSGKTVIGKKLSGLLGYGFIDLDDYIQGKEGKTIAEIFNKKGEIYFRKIESKYLAEVIDSNNNTIISLGGGTPCYGHNMDMIKKVKNTSSVYLKASIQSLSERLILEKDQRPLISHIESKELLNEFIGKHLFERSSYYSQSNITVSTDHKSVDDVIESIILKLF